MNKPTTEKAIRLVAEATLIGTVCGVPFYESPKYGDEIPLLYINKAGQSKMSDFWELPSFDELPADALFDGGR